MHSFSRRTTTVTTAVTLLIAAALVATTLVVAGTNEPLTPFASAAEVKPPREVTVPVAAAVVDLEPAAPLDDPELLPAPTVPVSPAPVPLNPPAPSPVPAPAPKTDPVPAPVPVPPTVTTPCATPTAVDPAAASVHTLLNEARAATGLPALTLSPSLNTVAASWAATLSKTSFVHNPNVGAQIPAGFGGWAENIFWASTETATGHLHDAWAASPRHRANMMNAEFTHVGVAVIRLPDGGTGAVQVFATYGVGCAV